MIVSADQIPQGSRLQADVCVVGGGPAGIALALALSGQGLSIVLLEAGRDERDGAAQDLYRGEVARERQHAWPHRNRSRGLGGSSSAWDGSCMPLDAIDFEARDWLTDGGWPIGYEELLPFYVAANRLAEAGRYAYDAREAFPCSPPLIGGFGSEAVRTTALERFSCPTHFGRRYRRRLAVASDLQVLCGAVCTAVRLAPGGREVQSLDGGRFSVSARSTVLAGGALETARLLLCSDDVAPDGVGNEHGVVGRYYMTPLAGSIGSLRVNGLPSDVRHGFELAPDGVYCRRLLTLSAARQRQHQLRNTVVRLQVPSPADPSHGSGVLSGLFLARRLAHWNAGRRVYGRVAPTAGAYARHALNLVSDPLDTAGALANWLRLHTLAPRKLPAPVLRNRLNRFSLAVRAEQQPLYSSHVGLTDQADALGMRRIRIDWRYSRDDIDSIARSLDLVGAELARSSAGRFSYRRETLEEDLFRDERRSGHHLGTARMGRDPRTSVVDSDGKVHAVANLFVTGSAVFPTCGAADPTLTSVALSLRLAQHLAQRLAVPSVRPTTEVAA